MRGMVGALICAAVGLIANSALARDFGVYGTNDGQLARDECPAGQYFVGIVGNTGSWIDQITVVCAELKSDMTFSGGRTLPSRGGSGGKFKQVMCDKNDEAISEIRIQRSPDYQIAGVWFQCLSINTGVRTPKLFNGSGNYTGDPPTQGCNSGELATGMIVRFSQYVNGLALICGPHALPAAACPSGQVWRESFDGDSFCVTPDARFRKPDGTCRSGYVWRGTFSGDNVCVTPAQREAAQKTAAKDTAAAAREALLGGVADFAGTWDTRTGQGAVYELTLKVDGETVTGEFVNSVDPQYNGTLTGKWMGDRRLHFKWTQPQTGVSGSGTFKVYTDGTIDGGFPYKPAGAVQPQYVKWSGTRKQGGATPPDVGAAPGGKTATAEASTDVYPDNSGKSQSTCTMNVGDTGGFVESKPDDPDWVHLTGISGECGGKAGWVWNGGSLNIR